MFLYHPTWFSGSMFIFPSFGSCLKFKSFFRFRSRSPPPHEDDDDPSPGAAVPAGEASMREDRCFSISRRFRTVSLVAVGGSGRERTRGGRGDLNRWDTMGSLGHEGPGEMNPKRIQALPFVWCDSFGGEGGFMSGGGERISKTQGMVEHDASDQCKRLCKGGDINPLEVQRLLPH